MRRELIILANSRKMKNRCVAGIDRHTGRWVRPVYGDGRQGVPKSIRQIDGAEPALLDVISVPLAEDGPHRDIQPENRLILPGDWYKLGEATLGEVIQYCQTKGLLLHNTDRRIALSELRAVPRQSRASLCLVLAHACFFTEPTYKHKKRVWARFRHDGNEYRIPVTDPYVEDTTPAYTKRSIYCLLTISLGLPFDKDHCCYKFVAGAIELSEAKLLEIYRFLLQVRSGGD